MCWFHIPCAQNLHVEHCSICCVNVVGWSLTVVFQHSAVKRCVLNLSGTISARSRRSIRHKWPSDLLICMRLLTPGIIYLVAFLPNLHFHWSTEQHTEKAAITSSVLLCERLVAQSLNAWTSIVVRFCCCETLTFQHVVRCQYSRSNLYSGVGLLNQLTGGFADLGRCAYDLKLSETLSNAGPVWNDNFLCFAFCCPTAPRLLDSTSMQLENDSQLSITARIELDFGRLRPWVLQLYLLLLEWKTREDGRVHGTKSDISKGNDCNLSALWISVAAGDWGESICRGVLGSCC